LTPFSQAVRDDRSYLLAYGAHLTVYCRRLHAIGTALQGGPLDWLVLDMDPATGALRAPPRPATDPLPRRIAIPFDPPTREQTPLALEPVAGRIVAGRLQSEQGDLRMVLKHFGIARSPVAEEIARAQEAQIRAMREDSHALGRTKHLHASPSLRDAVHDPSVYL
jgi:hypothetical protein